jgi:hypothetical protein
VENYGFAITLNEGGVNSLTGALNFYSIFIPLFGVRFRVSVFRIGNGAYLS